MTPLLQSFKRIWLCTLREMRPFVASRIDPYLTPHRVELLRKVFAHLDVAIDGQRNPKGGVLQATIVNDFAVCKSSISRMLSKMERDGFIYRTPWSMHPMYKVVHLTELGFEVMNIVRTLRFDEAAPDTQILEAFLGDSANRGQEDTSHLTKVEHPRGEERDVEVASSVATSTEVIEPTELAPATGFATSADPAADGVDTTSDACTEPTADARHGGEAIDSTLATTDLSAPAKPSSTGGPHDTTAADSATSPRRAALDALFRQCNAIRIRLHDNALHLHPWCIRESAERYADPELGISYWRHCRLREDDVDDRILDELPDEYLDVVGPFRPDNDVETFHDKWRRPHVA